MQACPFAFTYGAWSWAQFRQNIQSVCVHTEVYSFIYEQLVCSISSSSLWWQKLWIPWFWEQIICIYILAWFMCTHSSSHSYCYRMSVNCLTSSNWPQVLSSEERARLVENIVDHLRLTLDFIQERAVKNFTAVDPEFGNRVRQGLNAFKSPKVVSLSNLMLM